ncbi:MAG: desulfoferrodoxin [Candidatus Brocadiaceae bacterium]|nr:desulfoferrodoxin [Candidatus Brocadiaceae bacterium]
MERTGRGCKCDVCGTEIKITEDNGGMLKCCDQPMKLK